MRTVRQKLKGFICAALILCCIAVPIQAKETTVFEPSHFRELICTVLSEFAEQWEEPRLVSPEAVELLMLTAAQETHLGTYLHQIDGPALGVFQIEWDTYKDLMYNFVDYRPLLTDVLFQWQSPGVNDRIDLMGNLPYQIVVARLIYWRVPKKLPQSHEVAGMALYWKDHWNTNLGKGTAQEAVHNYTRLVLRED